MVNEYFCFTDLEGFGMGAEDNFGLYVQENMKDGYSHKC